MSVAARILVVTLALIVLTGGCGGGSQPTRVLLVILDTVRADHLSSYGYPHSTTPNLDRLAAEGERYQNAWAQSSWTLPAIASILTGRPPHDHGAGFVEGVIYPVRPGVPTVAEMLRDRGFRTAGIFNVVWCQPRSGLGRGFETYDHVMTDASNRNHRSASTTTDLALRWLGSLGRDESFFLAAHYFDPHLTYDPPAPFDTEFVPPGAAPIPEGFGSAGQVVGLRDGSLRLSRAERLGLIARYDGELRYMDEQIGRLRSGMERLGLWDDALVVVVADHGEEFWDHGSFEHGHSHFRELLRVPLIVRRPGGPQGLVLQERVRQLDVVPTILEHAGARPQEPLPGRPLGRGSAGYAVAEGTLWGGDLVSVRSDDGVLILDRDSGRVLYFAGGDVTEASAIATPPPPLLDLLRALPPPLRDEENPWEPTEEQLRQLRSLGYVQ